MKGEGKVFGSQEEVRIAYDAGEMGEHARIKVRISGSLVQTTAGRVILEERFSRPPSRSRTLIN